MPSECENGWRFQTTTEMTENCFLRVYKLKFKMSRLFWYQSGTLQTRLNLPLSTCMFYGCAFTSHVRKHWRGHKLRGRGNSHLCEILQSPTYWLLLFFSWVFFFCLWKYPYLVLSLGNPSTLSHKSFSPIKIINWFLWHSCVWHHQLGIDMLEAFWRSFLILIQSFKSWFFSHPA